MIRTALLLALLVAAPALATDGFPPIIQTRFSTPLPPNCDLCHTNGITAIGTVTTPFGANMRMRGLVAYDTASLMTALDQLVADNVDSDTDGVTDAAELMAGTNPNKMESATGGGAGGGGGSTTEVGPLKYGCGNSVVPELLLLAGLVPLLRRRSR